MTASAGAIFVFGVSVAAAEPLPQVLAGPVPLRFAGTRFGVLVLTQAVLGLAIVLATRGWGAEWGCG